MKVFVVTGESARVRESRVFGKAGGARRVAR